MSIDDTIKKEIRAAVQEILQPAIRLIIDSSIQNLAVSVTDGVVAKILNQLSMDRLSMQNLHDPNDMLSEKEAAVVVKKSPKTLRNYRYTLKKCEIPYRKEGGKILYKYADLMGLFFILCKCNFM